MKPDFPETSVLPSMTQHKRAPNAPYLKEKKRVEIVRVLLSDPRLSQDTVAQMLGVTVSQVFYAWKQYCKANPGTPARTIPKTFCVDCGKEISDGCARCQPCTGRLKRNLDGKDGRILEALRQTGGFQRDKIAAEIHVSLSRVHKVAKENGLCPGIGSGNKGKPHHPLSEEGRRILVEKVKAQHARQRQQPDGYAALRRATSTDEYRQKMREKALQQHREARRMANS